MSDEQRNEETEVEAHRTGIHASDEPRDEAETNDEVEGHGPGKLSTPSKFSANDEAEDEVEGHGPGKLSGPKYT